jgi:hypothetical protein
MMKMNARKRVAGRVESLKQADFLGKENGGRLSEENTADEAHTDVSEAIIERCLGLLGNFDKLAGRTCLSMFLAISTGRLPAREALCWLPIQIVLSSSCFKTLDPGNPSVALCAPQRVGDQSMNPAVWGILRRVCGGAPVVATGGLGNGWEGRVAQGCRQKCRSRFEVQMNFGCRGRDFTVGRIRDRG